MDEKRLPPVKKDLEGDSLNSWKIAREKRAAQIQKSRLMAYEEPPKDIADACYYTKKRLRDLKKKRNSYVKPLPREVEIEREKHIRIIGQLKAAEARNRIRSMRLRYEANKSQEISHLIACQPVALKAVRLQALVPPIVEVKERTDLLDKFERHRVEALLEDYLGLYTSRIR